MTGKERWRHNFWMHRLLGRSERQDRGTFNPRRVEQRPSILLRIEGLLLPERPGYSYGQTQVPVHVVHNAGVEPRLDGVHRQ